MNTGLEIFLGGTVWEIMHSNSANEGITRLKIIMSCLKNDDKIYESKICIPLVKSPMKIEAVSDSSPVVLQIQTDPV